MRQYKTFYLVALENEVMCAYQDDYLQAGAKSALIPNSRVVRVMAKGLTYALRSASRDYRLKPSSEFARANKIKWEE